MKIVVLDRDTIGLDTPLEGLNSFGEVVIYNSSTPEETLLRVRDAEIIILNKVKVTADVISAAERLKLICVFATGYDNIDIEAAKKQGIAVCNVAGYSTDSVTVFTIANVLALYTHLREYNSYVNSGEYSASGAPNKLVPVYHDLSGKTWGIIGLGNIGKSVAKVATALGARVIANKRTPVNDYECVDIDTLCRESDIITIHCPLNEDSRNLINKERIALMKKNVVIVNVARGPVINDEDITDAIKNGMIGAFGADVYTTEPFSTDHPFYEIKDFANVLFTPHAAWGSYEARNKCISIICDNISSFLSGKSKNRIV